MKLYLSDYRGNATNTQYQTATEIDTFEALTTATQKDHIAAAMKGAHRSSDDFLQADCIMLDLDNTHSDDPEDWKTTDDITEALPDVPFYYIHSRNHMKVKTKTARNGKVTMYEARPKYHCYFPLSRTYTDLKEYETLMLKAAGLFPFFDLGAAKPAQFFFGVENPSGGTESGDVYLDQYIEQQSPETIAASVREFAAKVKEGTYKQSEENEKAISRLYSYLGIKEPAPAKEAATPAPLAMENAAAADEAYSQLGYLIAEGEQRQRLEWLKKWAEKHNIALGRSYRIKSREHPGAICICVTCPWEEEHSMNGAENETVIIIELGGKLNFLCRHSHGPRYSWKDYRAYYEDRDKEQQEEPAEGQEQEPQPLPGLLTFDDVVKEFENADDSYITMTAFKNFSAAAKIKKHSSVVIAADTGVGKSSLALNFLNDLNGQYPCIYINLEMDKLTVLRRLVAIQSGIELDRIEGYKNDQNTAEAVNAHIKTITSRKPLQIIQSTYQLEQLEQIIKTSTAGRDETTVIFIDHSLLMDIQGNSAGRYDRFTRVSEGLRKIALKYNVILFVLLQQSRAGKAEEDERPKNSSLKESGSWENDATHIIFLWWDPSLMCKKIIMTKNRNGESGGEYVLNYWKKTQTYIEAERHPATKPATDQAPKKSKRDKQKEKLEAAYTIASIRTNGHPTLKAIAEAADVMTSTVKGWIKEYGGAIIDGQQVDPAGVDTVVEYNGFIKLTPNDEPFTDDATDGPTGDETGGNGKTITPTF